ncbi:EF-P lysine aminoacylase EpmA [Pokkaliibacter sp. CJK22405]|uniref:EF-P lysine aminoacylase EpmA n=1 Tax=Pokkaliibacter sp. CJK22405 TaxID=3384615 RepID=UPI00398559B2
MSSSDWQPGATIAGLQRRAALFRAVRRFFDERSVMEVDTPLLGAAGITDPFLTPMTAEFVPEGPGSAATLYLQTSPEYAMKRLLAAGSGAIYQLGKVFRNGEAGRRHNPEFTMLEWYRPGFNDHQLMDEVEALWLAVGGQDQPSRISYRDAFITLVGIDPHQASIDELRALAAAHLEFAFEDERRDTWLELLMSHVIEPELGKQGAVFVYDFPASQAALAQIAEDDFGNQVGRRFELYIRGIELCNGYYELTDAEEQRRRFAADNALRQQIDRPQLPVDEKLLAAMASGLPACAGVALGVDRLLMLLDEQTDIDQVLPFSFRRL